MNPPSEETERFRSLASLLIVTGRLINIYFYLTFINACLSRLFLSDR